MYPGYVFMRSLHLTLGKGQRTAVPKNAQTHRDIFCLDSLLPTE